MTTSLSPGGSAPFPVDAGALHLRLGSWNISQWTPAKAAIITQDIGVDVLAVQETHLASVPLEWAHGTCRNLGLHLLHGHPVPPIAHQIHGRSCGVGFVARQGVALSPVPPVGAAWRRLHAMSRLYCVRLPPRLGLPHGLLLFFFGVCPPSDSQYHYGSGPIYFPYAGVGTRAGHADPHSPFWRFQWFG